jgi:DNA repair photolyase
MVIAVHACLSQRRFHMARVNVPVIVKKVHVKTILSKSKVFDYTINPYIGCEHGCAYCYARLIKRFTGHREDWGSFVDVKTNAGDLLLREIKRKEPRRVWISGLCDPYQPLEKDYKVTQACLEILSEHDWPVTIQTKSRMVTRDIDLLKRFHDVEVGFTITTASENIKEIFEPNAPSIKERIETLKKLHSEGIKTFAMIAPLLPEAKDLVTQLIGNVDHVLIDKMNYHYADWVYRKNKLEYALTSDFFNREKTEFAKAFAKENIPCQLLF